MTGKHQQNDAIIRIIVPLNRVYFEGARIPIFFFIFIVFPERCHEHTVIKAPLPIQEWTICNFFSYFRILLSFHSLEFLNGKL